jgi:hypothetical protein
MAWRGHQRPKWKVCKGYGRAPHTLLYDNFPQIKRKRKDGTTYTVAQTYCRLCYNRWQREHKRLGSTSTRPQDVSWKKYRREGINRTTDAEMVAPETFLKWVDDAGVVPLLPTASALAVRRARASGRIAIQQIDAVVTYIGRPDLLQTFIGDHEQAS